MENPRKLKPCNYNKSSFSNLSVNVVSSSATNTWLTGLYQFQSILVLPRKFRVRYFDLKLQKWRETDVNGIPQLIHLPFITIFSFIYSKHRLI